MKIRIILILILLLPLVIAGCGGGGSGGGGGSDNTKAVYFVDADNGDDATGNGNQETPFASIAKALCEVTQAQQDIYVMTPANSGVYDETTDPCPGVPERSADQILAIPTGTSLYGGYDKNWKRDAANNPTPIATSHHGVLFTSVDIDAWFSGFSVQSNNSLDAGSSTYALSALGGSARIVIQDNQLSAGDVGTGIADNPGTSYGLRVALIEAATIERNVISAGSGGNGNNIALDFYSGVTERAEAGLPGKPGWGTYGRIGGRGGYSLGGEINYGGSGGGARPLEHENCTQCAGFPGVKGARDDRGGAVGIGGSRLFVNTFPRDGYPGGPGGDGDTGSEGANGKSGSGAGRLKALIQDGYLASFQPADGEQGKTGEAGGGGGGGGGGEASINQLETLTVSAKGGGGGSGGGGGAGGAGGLGGPGGGASIGIFIASINNVMINGNEITSDSGGYGATGGLGQTGGNGAPGGAGSDGYRIQDCLLCIPRYIEGGKGGTGGHGGTGRTGGNGGAGGGGPSYGIAIGVGTNPGISNNIVTSGNGGPGGIGFLGNDGKGGNSYAIYYDGVKDSDVPFDGNTLIIGSAGPGGEAADENQGSNIGQPIELTGPTFSVTLRCAPHNAVGNETGDAGCYPEEIEIPEGRPIYALLVSGFHQNRNFELLHFYNFARYLQKKGAYVHYAWWNNLLAPYMERPLHNRESIPSTGSYPDDEIENGLSIPVTPDKRKAIPGDDYQFQADAKALLTAIRAKEPDAKIILVGHSMGGGSIARLAQAGNIDDIDIALLAPIDPVGNRSCLPLVPETPGVVKILNCSGLANFKRYYALRQDYWTFPPPRVFAGNIKYLYYRWQNKGLPPVDFLESGLFTYTNEASTNHQSVFHGDDNSHLEATSAEYQNFGGLDDHGEIVGFRGSKAGWNFWDFHITVESDPVGLKALGDWPSVVRDINDKVVDMKSEARVDLMKQWDRQWDYLDLDVNGYAPQKPTDLLSKYPKCVDPKDDDCTYCNVSGDLISRFDIIMVTP